MISIKIALFLPDKDFGVWTFDIATGFKTLDAILSCARFHSRTSADEQSSFKIYHISHVKSPTPLTQEGSHSLPLESFPAHLTRYRVSSSSTISVASNQGPSSVDWPPVFERTLCCLRE